MEVIVLDGDQRPALAITRSLGMRGIRVTVGAEIQPSLASSSRFCAESFLYPSPYRDPAGFFREVLNRTRKCHQAVLLPVTDVTLGEVLRRRGEFGDGIAIPFENFEKFSLASDKTWVVSQCRTLGIPTPRTVLSTDYPAMEEAVISARNVGFPLVVKPSVSRIRNESGWIGTSVRYAQDEQDLRNILSREMFLTVPFLLQERIQGPGVGIFLLMRDGEVLASFAHRRIREKPPSGGVSVLCESIEPPAMALDAATRLLAQLRWNGVVMAEFKIDERDNNPKLLEVNARFWGSLQLAVSSGVDFPYYLFRMAQGIDLDSFVGYTPGLKMRWELGDLDHLLLRLFRDASRLSLASQAPSRSRVLADFVFDTFCPTVRSEVFRFRDGRPFLNELVRYVQTIMALRTRTHS